MFHYQEYNMVLILKHGSSGQLRALSDALTPTLHSFRQKEFYIDPRFHASIAWALLDTKPINLPSGSKSIPGSMSVLQTAQEVQGPRTSKSGSSLVPNDASLTSTSTYPFIPSPIPDVPSIPTYPQKEFLAIPHFPPTLIPTLVDKHTAQLTRVNIGAFEVDEVRVKIGKWVGGWALQG